MAASVSHMIPLVPGRLLGKRRPGRTVPALLGAALATGVLVATAAGDSARAPAGAAIEEAEAGMDAAHGPEARPEEVPPAGGSLPRAADEAALALRLDPLLETPRVRLAVTVFDPATGRSLTYGSGRFETASTVKVDVVAAALLQAQDAGRELTAEELRLASEAIRLSDNDATHELWRLIGREAGLDAANDRLGLTGTTGGAGGRWGLTRTTTEDRITLLRAVFGAASPLSADSRELLRGLMGSVAEGQDWGISAAATGEGTALKNGWVPRTHSGLWHVNSTGRITAGEREYLVAVLSAGHQSQEEGIVRVESAARAAVDVIRTVPGV